jgi:hypothetical protein
MVADRAEKSSKAPPAGKVARPDTPEDSNEDAIVPDTLPLVGESQGGATIALAIGRLNASKESQG